MKIPIFYKIFGGYILIIVVLSSLIIFFSFTTIRENYIDSLTENLKNFGKTLSFKVIDLLERKDYQGLNSLSKKLGIETKIRITIIDPDGIVLADSEHDPKLMENHKSRPEILSAIENGFGKSIRYSSTLKKEMLYVALPLFKKDTQDLSGVVRVSLFLSDVNSLLKNLQNRIFKISVFLVLVSVLVAIFLSRNLSRPINLLKEATQKITAGDFDTRIFLKNNDELKELAESFNNMSEKMRIMFDEISSKKEELTRIISSIQEGLLLLNKKGEILLSNESLRKLSEVENIENKYYWEIIKNPEFNDLIKNAIQNKKNMKKEIELNNRIFLCSVTFLETREEIIVLFHDITELKNIEEMKRDFVTNVSHELRTPLTAIKGFIETIEEEVDIKIRHYIDIIRVHTDRLINIVQDLLILSDIERKGSILELENLDIVDLVSNVLKMFTNKIKAKNLEMEINVDKNIPAIKADSFKIEQMIINLIDNAIKYTDKGMIKISIKKKDESVILEIEDTGIGIPKEYLNRIFERFFVVDKSRSRKLGGTGLGLSIVKHIVNLHNGEIYVESTPGIGTKFTVVLPINPA